VFPKEKSFETHSSDIFEDYLILTPANHFFSRLKKMGVLQTGKIQHYLLYSLLFLIVIYLLTILNWI